MSQDPWEGDIRDPQSLNKYSYVINNSLKYVDPTGMCAWDACVTENAVISYGIGIFTAWYEIYVATKDNDIPTIIDTAPPKTNKEPLFTPYGEGFADGASKTTTVPASPQTEQKVTTIPSDSKAPQIVSIPSENKGVKDNLMMDKGKPRSTLSKDKSGNYLPDPQANGAHTRLKTGAGRRVSKYRQGATFDEKGNFVGRTDVTDHGRSDHFNPHFHPRKTQNSTKPGTGNKIKWLKYKIKFKKSK